MSNDQFDKEAGKLLRAGIKMLRETIKPGGGIGLAVGLEGVLMNPDNGEHVHLRLLFSDSQLPANNADMVNVYSSAEEPHMSNREIH